MKFICTQENLSRGLHVVSRAASKNVSLPILNNVLLIAEGGAVRLQTTNLEVAITTIVRAKIETEGRYTVNSRLFTDFVSTVKGDHVTVQIVGDGLQVQSDQTETVIRGMPADEFPILPIVQQGESVEVPASVFSRALREVVFAVATDETRPEICGVYLSLQQRECNLAATDSHRLSERTIVLPVATTAAVHAIIPARAAQEILRITEDESASMILQIDEQQASVQCGETTLVTRLIEGQYPEYRQLIPSSFEVKVTLKKDEFLDAVRAASLFSQPGIHDIAIKVGADKDIQIFATSTQAGRHTATVAAEVDGGEKEVVFNSRYVIDGIQNLPGDEIQMELGGAQAPGVLRPTATVGAVYLIMPIRQ